MKKMFLQFVRFIGISGVGWCIDFSLYLMLTSVFRWPVFISNCLSAVPAVTLVFSVSTAKIFRKAPGKIPVYAKYVIYLIYQFILLLIVSSLGQWLSDVIILKATMRLIVDLSKVIAKVMITPVTMVMNFLIMKLLSENC